MVTSTIQTVTVTFMSHKLWLIIILRWKSSDCSDDGGDTACEEEDDQNHNHVMEKCSYEDDCPDIGGNESIDGPSESGIHGHSGVLSVFGVQTLDWNFIIF